MSKLAIVVQRYGAEVNGGAELHAKILAEKLSSNYEIDILTSKALNYTDWADYYEKDIEYINNIRIRRFSSTHIKKDKEFRKNRRAAIKNKKIHQFLKRIQIYSFFDKKGWCEPSTKENNDWLKSVGPYCPSLIEYIHKNKNSYTCFIFFTYMYYPTVEGLKAVGDKSIYIPTAHDEPELYAPVYKSTFENAKFIMYNTLSEKKLVHNIFDKMSSNNNIAGVGIESYRTEDHKTIPCEFQFNFEYVLYIGRVDHGKGCDELYSNFQYYKSKHPLSKLKLIFLGQKITDLPEKNDILFTGFVSEEVKRYVLNNCKALVIPSYFESLSMVTLEAMLDKKIVIANSKCEVLKNHILKSNSGYYYENQNEFCTTIKKLNSLTDIEIKEHGEKATKYVQENYSWSTVLNKFEKAIEFIQNS